MYLVLRVPGCGSLSHGGRTVLELLPQSGVSRIMKPYAGILLLAAALHTASADSSIAASSHKDLVVDGVRFTLSATPRPTSLGWDLVLSLTAMDVDGRNHHVAIDPMHARIAPGRYWMSWLDAGCGWAAPPSRRLSPGTTARFERIMPLAIAEGEISVEVTLEAPDSDCVVRLALISMRVPDRGTPSAEIDLATRVTDPHRPEH